MNPNLFTYATSELSQDAIICWLLEWAKSENKEVNNALHIVGVSFLDSLFAKFEDKEKPSHYRSIKIYKQYKNIDVLCVVNDEYALIIEDKTNTKNHSKQLEKYLSEMKKEYMGNKILPIYFKTGDQSNYASVSDKGYKVYLRKDFLSVLALPFKNDILHDYKLHLQKIEQDINSYKTKNVNEWSSYAVKGFYMALQNELQDGNWDYVPNSSGGFWGFWWNNNQLDSYRIYMQIDATKKKNMPRKMALKFKVTLGTKEKVDKNIINFWKHHIKYSSDEYTISKPRVVRVGRWTTVGIMDNFLVFDKDNKINMQKSIKSLRRIEKILQQKIATIKE